MQERRNCCVPLSDNSVTDAQCSVMSPKKPVLQSKMSIITIQDNCIRFIAGDGVQVVENDSVQTLDNPDYAVLGINTDNKFQFLASSNMHIASDISTLSNGLINTNDDQSQSGTSASITSFGSAPIFIHEISITPYSTTATNYNPPSCTSGTATTEISIPLSTGQFGVYILEVVGNTIESVTWNTSADGLSCYSIIMPDKHIALLDFTFRGQDNNTCVVTLAQRCRL